MKEYIEREALEKDFNSRLNDLVAEYGQYDHYVRGFDEAVDRLEDAPAADVVEVVRCKDCKYCIPATADGAEYELCIVDDDVFPVSVQRQHFCSRGKRKEE